MSCHAVTHTQAHTYCLVLTMTHRCVVCCDCMWCECINIACVYYIHTTLYSTVTTSVKYVRNAMLWFLCAFPCCHLLQEVWHSVLCDAVVHCSLCPLQASAALILYLFQRIWLIFLVPFPHSVNLQSECELVCGGGWGSMCVYVCLCVASACLSLICASLCLTTTCEEVCLSVCLYVCLSAHGYCDVHT